MSLFISVVICTYNREDLITGCLDSLAEQTADKSKFEVLVIDNNSTDDTYNLVSNYSRLENLRLISEPMQGLSHARNRGLLEANGEYIAYLDDDARVDKNYIENLYRLYDQFSDTVDCFGGPILPFYTTQKPEWFKDSYETRRDKKEPHYLTLGQSFSGSNMIWKKCVLEDLGGFDPSFGMIGNRLWGGEETTLFNKLWENKQPIFYFSPNLIVYHWVPPHKMKVRYQLKRVFAVGQTMGKIEVEKAGLSKKFLAFINHGLWSLLNVGRAIIHVNRHQKIENWVVEEIGQILIRLGKTLAVIGISFNLKQKA